MATRLASLEALSPANMAVTQVLYNKQVLTWSLSKDKLEMEKLNQNSVLFAEKTFPQIRMKIYNFVEFGKES